VAGGTFAALRGPISRPEKWAAKLETQPGIRLANLETPQLLETRHGACAVAQPRCAINVLSRATVNP
jgi:hypothetical protein